MNTATSSNALTSNTHPEPIAFIGGGNMASAIIGGLIRQGTAAALIDVIEPSAPARAALEQQFGVNTFAQSGPELARAAVVVWAVKPQIFCEATQPVRHHTEHAVHLSVAAGIRSSSIAQWLGSERIVRAMPNTPALIGQGMTALYARPAVSAQQRQSIEQIIASTGAYLWVDDEVQLDSVTALSGSGPAYVFFFLEAMIEAGVGMGLNPAQAHQLAVATFSGASELARRSTESPAVLRERVTSKGGTTYAALQSLEHHGVRGHFIEALQAAQQRARELGDEFGG